MQCELCGRKTKSVKRVLIEGSEIDVCEKCSSLGKTVPRGITADKGINPRKKMGSQRDIYAQMDKELVPNWGQKIKQARQKKKVSREKLGAAIGERTGTVAKIENEELHPTDEMVKNIERELDILLLQEVTASAITTGGSRKNLTIGDLLKNGNGNT
jgi:putative transcription factor